jgi:glycosyltransferase involved in cell wall biosynthesis
VSTPPASRGKLKLVTLIDRLGTHGGAERLAMQIVTRIDGGRFERTLCASRASSDARTAADLAELAEAGVRFVGLERRSRVQLWSWWPLASLLRRERVDILHAHKFGSNIWGTLLGRATRVPVVVTHEHSWAYEGKPLRRLIDRELIARGSDAFVAVSREDQRRMIEVEKIDSKDTVFVPNGIPTPPGPSGHDVRSELGISAAQPVIGAVGFLRAAKDYEVLIRAAAVLVGDFPDLRVLIVGEGEERPKLEALIGELGLAETVLLTGLRSDVPDVLAALDVAVSSSKHEGSPLSLMEYMAAGKPVVATAVGGVPDLIDESVEGLLVPPGDPAGLAAGVAALLRDREAAARMGERGRERRSREFDIDVMVRNLEALYVDLYEAKRGSLEPALTPSRGAV